MLESHLVAGQQSYDPKGKNTYSQSITDGCIDFDRETSGRVLLEQLAERTLQAPTHQTPRTAPQITEPLTELSGLHRSGRRPVKRFGTSAGTSDCLELTTTGRDIDAPALSHRAGQARVLDNLLEGADAFRL